VIDMIMIMIDDFLGKIFRSIVRSSHLTTQPYVSSYDSTLKMMDNDDNISHKGLFISL